MLTIKHIDPKGPERVFAVREIEYVSASVMQSCQACEVGFTPSTGRITFVHMNGDLEFVYSGTVYAMNDSGKTVQKYDIGGWALPVGGPLPPPSDVNINVYPAAHAQRIA